MGKFSAIIALIVLGALLVGCAPSDVVLEVEGRKLTVIERDAEINLRVKLLRIANPEINEAIVDNRRKSFLASLERHFIDETILLKVACDRKLTATTDEIAHHMDSFTRFFDSLSPAEQALAKSIAKREVLCEKAKQSIAAETFDKISPGELDQALNRLKAYSEMVAITNRLIYAHATNVWRKVCNGMDFASAARQYSEAEDCSSCEWGAFPLTAFSQEPQLLHIVEKLQIGKSSPPVEGDNGLVIVHLTGIDSNTTPPRYNLERIFFRLPEEAPKMNVKEVADCLMTEKKRSGLAAKLDKLRKAVHITRK